MIELVVMEELKQHFLGQHQLGEDLWLFGDVLTCGPGQMLLSVSNCPGGAYAQLGHLLVGEIETVFTVKTVWGIMGHRSVMTKHYFEYCDPAFPDNLVAFVKRAAFNTNKCYKLQSRRFWMHYGRELRQSKPISSGEIGGVREVNW